MLAEQLTLETPYLTLRAQAWGPNDGIPVLALHGWMDNSNSFAPISPFLEKIRLVALDLPGQGLSQWKPPGTHYHFIDFCSDILFAADALKWQNFNILGHSFGAAIGLVSACMEQDRVNRLALIDNFGPRVDTGVQTIQRLRHANRDFRQLPKKKVSIYKTKEEAIRVRHMVSDLNNNNIEILIERGLKRSADGYTWSSDPQLKMVSPTYLHEQQLLAFLPHLIAPTLLIRAQSGYLVNRNELERRYALVRQLQIVDLPGGHHIHMEHPNSVAHYLEKFFI